MFETLSRKLFFRSHPMLMPISSYQQKYRDNEISKPEYLLNKAYDVNANGNQRQALDLVFKARHLQWKNQDPRTHFVGAINGNYFAIVPTQSLKFKKLSLDNMRTALLFKYVIIKKSILGQKLHTGIKVSMKPVSKLQVGYAINLMENVGLVSNSPEICSLYNVNCKVKTHPLKRLHIIMKKVFLGNLEQNIN